MRVARRVERHMNRLMRLVSSCGTWNTFLSLRGERFAFACILEKRLWRMRIERTNERTEAMENSSESLCRFICLSHCGLMRRDLCATMQVLQIFTILGHGLCTRPCAFVTVGQKMKCERNFAHGRVRQFFVFISLLAPVRVPCFGPCVAERSSGRFGTTRGAVRSASRATLYKRLVDR